MKHIQTSLCLALVIFSHVVVANDTGMDRYLRIFENLIEDLEEVGSGKSCGDNFIMTAANARMKFATSLANLGDEPDMSNFTMEQMQKYLGLAQRMTQAQVAINQKQVRCL